MSINDAFAWILDNSTAYDWELSQFDESNIDNEVLSTNWEAHP